MKLVQWDRGGEAGFGIVDEAGGVFDVARRSGGRIGSLQALIGRGSSGLGEWMAGPPDLMRADVTLRPPIPQPCKIICIGINYPDQIGRASCRERV